MKTILTLAILVFLAGCASPSDKTSSCDESTCVTAGYSSAAGNVFCADAVRPGDGALCLSAMLVAQARCEDATGCGDPSVTLCAAGCWWKTGWCLNDGSFWCGTAYDDCMARECEG